MQWRNNTMTQKSEVFLEIFTDNTSEQLLKAVLKSLATYGIRERYYTEGTNHIRAFTKGNESEISEKVTRIQELPHVKKVMKEILVPV
jgi:hypothetical protein